MFWRRVQRMSSMKRAFTPAPIVIKDKLNKQLVRGFTLVEIMIVVGIVIVLVMLAVPNILRSRVVAYEGSAIANLKTINNACQLYHINEENYPAGLSDLSEPNSDPAYLDSTLASGKKQSYEFMYQLISDDSFTVNANPLSGGLLKGRYFYMDESGVIRSNNDGAAGPQDEIVK